MANHPIFYAVHYGDVASVREYLDARPDLINARTAKNLTPLHVAASRGQVAVARLLLDRGADVDGRGDSEGWTPLVWASYRGHYDVVKLLLDRGVGASESDGNPIHYAGQRGHRAICRLLVEHGAVDDLVGSADADPLRLFRAAYSYDSRSAESILSKRPELVNCRDRNDRTPLHEACTNGDARTVKVLLRCGADVQACDNRNQTPLDRALAHRKHRVVKALQEAGAASSGVRGASQRGRT